LIGCGKDLPPRTVSGRPASSSSCRATLASSTTVAGLTHVGYRDLLETLSSEALAFPGQVLLIHGDTHWQRIDQPLRDPTTGRPISNFTRLETFGYPLMGWVKVIVDSEYPQLFRFEVHPYRRR
jgi:hypothetical protein